VQDLVAAVAEVGFRGYEQRGRNNFSETAFVATLGLAKSCADLSFRTWLLEGAVGIIIIIVLFGP